MIQLLDDRAEIAIGAAAAAGALAGLVGGVAMLVARKLEARGLLGEEVSGEPEWERLVRAEARRRKVRLSRRRTALLATTLHLAYSAALGSAYGIVRTRRALPTALQGTLMSGLVSAAAFPTVAPARKRRPARPSRKHRLKKALIPIGAHAVFATTIVAAFGVLVRMARPQGRLVRVSEG